jgi:hypothetical protein
MYIVPLETLGILIGSESNILFSNILQIIEFNEEMFRKFASRKTEVLESGSDLCDMTVSDIFSEMVRIVDVTFANKTQVRKSDRVQRILYKSSQGFGLPGRSEVGKPSIFQIYGGKMPLLDHI